MRLSILAGALAGAVLAFGFAANAEAGSVSDFV